MMGQSESLEYVTSGVNVYLSSSPDDTSDCMVIPDTFKLGTLTVSEKVSKI